MSFFLPYKYPSYKSLGILFWIFLVVPTLAQESTLKLITPDQAKKDINTLKEVLEAVHPAIYLHQTKEEWEAKCQATINSVDTTLNSKYFLI